MDMNNDHNSAMVFAPIGNSTPSKDANHGHRRQMEDTRHVRNVLGASYTAPKIFDNSNVHAESELIASNDGAPLVVNSLNQTDVAFQSVRTFFL